MTEVQTIDRCRLCGFAELEFILSLGDVPLANELLPESEIGKPARCFPLRVSACPACGLVQLMDTVPPADLFTNYLYQTSTSTTMRKHFGALAGLISSQFTSDPGDLVVEIGSNDGCLLQQVQGRRVLGIEPATNIAELAVRNGVETLNRFFDMETAKEIAHHYGEAKVIVACNVLAHVPDLPSFLPGVVRLLKPDGVFIVEVPHLDSLVSSLAYDTIYHEHVFYFSLAALSSLFDRFGLTLFDAETMDVHGGSLRLYVGHKKRHTQLSARLQRLIQSEKDNNRCSAAGLRAFSDKVSAHRQQLGEHLRDLRASGAHVAGYGAAAKATVLMNVCGLDRSLVSYVVDAGKLKQGLYIPGVGVPILPPEMLVRDRPDFVVIFPWNISGEIISQEQKYLSRGGQFIIPLPALRRVAHG